jgi:putative peptidoglycan lipid II flippase
MEVTARIPAPGTRERRMLADTATVGLWTALSKVVGAGKVFIAARLFGTGDAMDAFLVAFLLPSFVADVLAGPMDTVLVPAFVRAKNRKGGNNAHVVYSQVLMLSVATLGAIALLAAAASGWLLPILGASFSAEKLGYTRFLFFVMLPVIPLSGPWIAARSVLNAEGRFAIAAALPVVTPALCIAVLLAGGRRWGMNSLAIATVAGIALQAAACVTVAWWSGFRIQPQWAGYRQTTRYLTGQYAPVVALSVVAGSSALIDQAFAGMLVSGSVSALNYGTRLATVLMSLGPLAVGTVVLAHASSLIRDHNVPAAFRVLGRYAGIAFAVSSLIIAGLILVSEPALRLVLRGGAFTGDQLHGIARLQSVSLLQVPFTILLAIGIRLIAAARENRMLYGLAATTVASTLVLDSTFVKSFGLIGIPIAGCVVRLVSVLYVFCKIRNLRALEFPSTESPDVS